MGPQVRKSIRSRDFIQGHLFLIRTSSVGQTTLFPSSSPNLYMPAVPEKDSHVKLSYQGWHSP